MRGRKEGSSMACRLPTELAGGREPFHQPSRKFFTIHSLFAGAAKQKGSLFSFFPPRKTHLCPKA